MNSSQAISGKLLLIPLITILSGFIPFCLLSIYFRVFWINTIYDVPLVYNFSVIIGDSILLPLINYQIGKLLIEELSIRQILRMKKMITIWVIIAIILSIFINVFAHLAWKNDIYSDFISTDRSKFILSGWWHLSFSILEMTILFTFPLFWYTLIKQKFQEGIKRCFKIWALIFIFSTLAIFDMIVKYFLVYKIDFWETLMTDYFAFVTPIVSILLLLFMSSKRAKFIGNE